MTIRCYKYVADFLSAGVKSESMAMTIILRGDSAATPVNTRIELYPIDFAAVQRDYSAALRPGKTFDDFLAQRIKGLVPVQPQIDRNGRAQAKLSEGNW